MEERSWEKARDEVSAARTITPRRKRRSDFIRQEFYTLGRKTRIAAEALKLLLVAVGAQCFRQGTIYGLIDRSFAGQRFRVAPVRVISGDGHVEYPLPPLFFRLNQPLVFERHHVGLHPGDFLARHTAALNV